MSVPKLPPMSDVHQLFNPSVAPPLTTKAALNPDGSVGSIRGVSKLLRTLQRKNSKQSDLISLPTNFRHVVHIGSDRIEVYDEKGFAIGISEKSRRVMDIVLEKKDAGFGLNLKTLDDGKTIISLVQPGGAAERCGLLVADEISHIEGEPIEGLKHDDVINKIRGKTSVRLKIVRFTEEKSASASASSPSGAGLSGEDSAENLGCRVCGAMATFNCSACGPHITYCSVECQKSDWPTHKLDCQSVKQKVKEEEKGGSIPNTGACRVCRAKNARYRCACAGAMYCSQQCQIADWPTHKNNCTAMGETAGAQGDPSKFTFFAVAEKWLSKMAFINGVFDCKWTIPLTCPDDKIPMHPTVHVAGRALVVSFADRVTSIDLESGSTNWTTPLGFPFEGAPLSIVDYEDIIVIGGAGHLLALERRGGDEVWRKLVSKNFSSVTMLLQSNILFAVCEQNLYCVILEDDEATLSWRTPVSSLGNSKSLYLTELESAPAIVVAGEKIITCRPYNGQVIKNKSLGDSAMITTLSAKGKTLLSLRNGTVTRYSPKDLSVVWEVAIPECEGKEGTMLQSSLVLEGSEGEAKVEGGEASDVAFVGIFCRVVAIDIKTGEIKWVAKLTKLEDESSGMVTMVLLGDDLIAATAGRVFALSASSGNPLRKAQLPQKDNPTRFISMVTQDCSTATVSCLAAFSSLYTRS